MFFEVPIMVFLWHCRNNFFFLCLLSRILDEISLPSGNSHFHPHLQFQTYKIPNNSSPNSFLKAQFTWKWKFCRHSLFPSPHIMKMQPSLSLNHLLCSRRKKCILECGWVNKTWHKLKCLSKPAWISFFCRMQKKIFWRMMVTKQFWFPFTFL